MKILICDDHKIVRAGIRQLLQQYPGIEYIKEASNGNEAVEILQNNEISTVILDVLLPGISGLEMLELIKKRWSSLNVLMMSMYAKEQDAIRAFKLGASGYLCKDAALEELFTAVKKVEAGGKYVPSSVAENLAHYVSNNTSGPKHDMLSKREYVTMLKLARGRSLGEIGKELLISSKTVSTYRTRIMRKMKLRKNTELTKYCLENQLI